MFSTYISTVLVFPIECVEQLQFLNLDLYSEDYCFAPETQKSIHNSSEVLESNIYALGIPGVFPLTPFNVICYTVCPLLTIIRTITIG